MRSSLSDQVVVVTGASSGIGRATVLHLAELGAHVVAVARRMSAFRDLEQDAAGRLQRRIDPHALDVTDADALRALADEVVAKHGRLDAWVNNAAVNLYGPADGPPIADTRRVIETNLGGYINGTYAALPHLREQGRGVIVNVTSVLGRVPAPYQAAYVATKHAIHGWTGAVRQEVRRDGIAICEVAPGPVDTPLFQQAGNYMGVEVVPLSPLAAPERIARAVAQSIMRPRNSLVVGAMNRIVVGMSRLSSSLTERLAGWQTEREHFGDVPAVATAGNLHDPDGGTPPTITGGWGELSRTRRRLALVGASMIGLVAWTAHTRRR